MKKQAKKAPETPMKPQKRNGGRGKLRGAEDGVPFTKDNQPSPKAKSDGWTKKRTLKEILAMEVSGVVSAARRKELLEYLGLPANTSISIEQMLHLKQIITSLKSNTHLTTSAYEAIMKRAFGTNIDLTSEGKSIAPQPNIIVPDEATRQALLKLRQSGKDGL